MYDNEKLEKSEVYFSLLQLLRISSEWVAESSEHLEWVAQTCNSNIRRYMQVHNLFESKDTTGRNLGENLQEVVAWNWRVVLKFHRKESQALLAHIDRKIEEIKSLRDGLFNAQSVRETVKATRINQYLLVFTIVTIGFLPPSFVATFYGMHLFDGKDTGETQRRFWATFVAVTAVTYLGAVSALFGLHWRRRLQVQLGQWLLKARKKCRVWLIHNDMHWFFLPGKEQVFADPGRREETGSRPAKGRNGEGKDGPTGDARTLGQPFLRRWRKAKQPDAEKGKGKDHMASVSTA
ncbi:hypothetical protein VTK26DRAFT_6057 [Humicola hyalothermophila]